MLAGSVSIVAKRTENARKTFLIFMKAVLFNRFFILPHRSDGKPLYEIEYNVQK